MHDPIIAAVLLQALLIAAPDLGDEAKAQTAPAATEATAAKEPEFKPPPGFRARKRGQYTVYCHREEPKGTRFPAEVCYDEEGLRQLAQSLREEQVKVDQIRRMQTATVR
jgi:hypothetical protein